MSSNPVFSVSCVKSPRLTHLVLRGVSNNVSLERISRFTKLQSLELKFTADQDVDLEFLHKLGQQMHNLLDLHLEMGGIQPYTNLSSVSRPNFRNLRRLHIRGNPKSIKCILDEVRNIVTLVSLTIDEHPKSFDYEDRDTSWVSSFEAISTLSAIEDLQIEYCSYDDGDSYPLSISWLSPLLKLGDMKSLSIDNVTLSGSDSDDGFRLLARAFPKLKKFVVPPPPAEEEAERTLACLYHISQGCPDLREITIYLNSSIAEDLNAIKQLPHPIVRNYCHPLKTLYIEYVFGQPEPVLVLTHLLQIVQFLDDIFPNLSNLEMYTKGREAENILATIREVHLALQHARISE